MFFFFSFSFPFLSFGCVCVCVIYLFIIVAFAFFLLNLIHIWIGCCCCYAWLLLFYFVYVQSRRKFALNWSRHTTTHSRLFLLSFFFFVEICRCKSISKIKIKNHTSLVAATVVNVVKFIDFSCSVRIDFRFAVSVFFNSCIPLCFYMHYVVFNHSIYAMKSCISETKKKLWIWCDKEQEEEEHKQTNWKMCSQGMTKMHRLTNQMSLTGQPEGMWLCRCFIYLKIIYFFAIRFVLHRRRAHKALAIIW